MSRKVSEGQKKIIAGRQQYKCANKPFSNLLKLEKYNCPLWERENNQGCFDESGYEIDHIIEHSLTGNDSLENLQALCVTCHRVKTKRFNVTRIKKTHPIYGLKLNSYKNHTIYLSSSKKIYKHSKIWSKNRPVDESRLSEIASYIKKNDSIDGVIYLANIPEEGLVCYDGNHRRTSIGLLDKDYKVLVDIVENPSYEYLCEKFKTLNKCIPLMELYENPDKYNDEFKIMIYEVLDKICKKWPKHTSSSPNPKRPNFNRDIFGNELTKFIIDNMIYNLNFNILYNALLKLNNYNKENIHNLKLSSKVKEKCINNDCYLFVNKLDNLKLFIESSREKVTS